MEIIRNLPSEQTPAFSRIRGGKEFSDILANNEKNLLLEMAQALTVIYGGIQSKRRPQSA